MQARNILAILSILVGVVGLVYGGFSYTSDVHMAEIGSLRMAFSEKEHVYIPVWAGVAFILFGGVLFMTGKKI